MSAAVKQYAPTQEEVDRLYEQLRKIQEPKGYHFNKDYGYTCPLLEQLLVTKARYGYMACPLPVRQRDLRAGQGHHLPLYLPRRRYKKYGACFCGLYVSWEWNEGGVRHNYVSDRRPPDKIKF